jgi:hypothetical protein
MTLKDIFYIVVFAGLWIALIFKKASLHDWIFQYENVYISYTIIAVPILLYAASVIISRLVKIKYLKKK